jgi:G protein-coupled receptor 149
MIRLSVLFIYIHYVYPSAVYISSFLIMEFYYCFHLAKRKGFEFNLSFQQSFGIYKIAHEDYYDDDGNSISYHDLVNHECEVIRDSQRDNHNIFSAIKVEISTRPSLDSATLTGINKGTNTDITEAKQDPGKEKGAFSDKTGSGLNYEETVCFESPERRLSHEENQKPDLSDWEWCRSKSERTPRQVW